MDFDILWKFFVSDFMEANIDVNWYSSVFSFANLVNVLENLYYLRHHDYLLNNFLQNIRDFYEFFNSCIDGDWDLFDPIDDLKNFLNIVDIPHNLFKFFSVDKFLDAPFNFYDLCCFWLDGYYFFLFPHYFFDGFDDGGDFN